MAENAWKNKGNCRDHPTEMFFPVSRNDADPAIEICSGCQVFYECMCYAREVGVQDGVWAGVLYLSKHDMNQERHRIKVRDRKRREKAERLAGVKVEIEVQVEFGLKEIT